LPLRCTEEVANCTAVIFAFISRKIHYSPILIFQLFAANRKYLTFILIILQTPRSLLRYFQNQQEIMTGGMNFTFYRSIKTLLEYILIDFTSIAVEDYSRQSNNCRLLKEFKQFSNSFFISPIGLTLFLKDIYDDVNFSE
jgi:hypothetical protein